MDCCISVPLTLQQATVDPLLHQKLLDTHRHVWVSLLLGPCSFLLGSGAHRVLFVPSKSLFPQSYVSSVIKSNWLPKSNSLGVFSPFAKSPGWEIYCVSQNFLNSMRIYLVLLLCSLWNYLTCKSILLHLLIFILRFISILERYKGRHIIDLLFLLLQGFIAVNYSHRILFDVIHKFQCFASFLISIKIFLKFLF